MALYLKSCPRCRGDMHSNKDIYGEYRLCLQCGHMVDIDSKDNLFSLNLDNNDPKRKAA